MTTGRGVVPPSRGRQPFDLRSLSRQSREAPAGEPQWGASQWFVLEDRVFQASIAVGARVPLVGDAFGGVNEMLAGLVATRGYAYAGLAAAPTFRDAPGWFTSAEATVAATATMSRSAGGATIPYLDEAAQLPPTRTLDVLPVDGVAVWSQVSTPSPTWPLVRRAVPGRPDLDARTCRARGPFEGVRNQRISFCLLQAVVADQYTVTVYVFFGRRHPTDSQRAGAQDALDHLVLPTWPRWSDPG